MGLNCVCGLAVPGSGAEGRVVGLNCVCGLAVPGSGAEGRVVGLDCVCGLALPGVEHSSKNTLAPDGSGVF